MKALMYLGMAALTVFAAADCAQSTPQQRAGVPRWFWMVLIIIVPVVGPIVWLLVSRLPGIDRDRAVRNSASASGSGFGSTSGTSRSGRAGGRKKFSSPDDDPEFLWRLEQQQQAERKRNQKTDAAESGGSDASSEDGPGPGPEDGPEATGNKTRDGDAK